MLMVGWYMRERVCHRIGLVEKGGTCIHLLEPSLTRLVNRWDRMDGTWFKKRWCQRIPLYQFLNLNRISSHASIVDAGCYMSQSMVQDFWTLSPIAIYSLSPCQMTMTLHPNDHHLLICVYWLFWPPSHLYLGGDHFISASFTEAYDAPYSWRKVQHCLAFPNKHISKENNVEGGKHKGERKEEMADDNDIVQSNNVYAKKRLGRQWATHKSGSSMRPLATGKRVHRLHAHPYTHTYNTFRAILYYTELK